VCYHYTIGQAVTKLTSHASPRKEIRLVAMTAVRDELGLHPTPLAISFEIEA
jgi:hypothetical protein